MKNAHLPHGSLRFTKVPRNTIDITLRMDKSLPNTTPTTEARDAICYR